MGSGSSSRRTRTISEDFESQIARRDACLKKLMRIAKKHGVGITGAVEDVDDQMQHVPKWNEARKEWDIIPKAFRRTTSRRM